jgi:hypothetical protein
VGQLWPDIINCLSLAVISQGHTLLQNLYLSFNASTHIILHLKKLRSISQPENVDNLGFVVMVNFNE